MFCYQIFIRRARTRLVFAEFNIFNLKIPLKLLFFSPLVSLLFSAQFSKLFSVNTFTSTIHTAQERFSGALRDLHVAQFIFLKIYFIALAYFPPDFLFISTIFFCCFTGKKTRVIQFKRITEIFFPLFFVCCFVT